MEKYLMNTELHSLNLTSRLFLLLSLTMTLAVSAGCTDEEDSVDFETYQTVSSAVTPSGALGTRLRTAAAQHENGASFDRINPHHELALSIRGGEVVADVLIEMDRAFAHASARSLEARGVDIRTITRNGIASATMPLRMAHAAAAVSGVRRIELASRVEKHNDESGSPEGMNIPGDYPISGPTGAGVIVGVIDTGLDYTHSDFLNADGTTRVLALWDQSDTADYRPPAGLTYGTTYTTAELNDCLVGTGYCATTDSDGHGTHVAGTAAGNGTAFGTGSAEYQYAGGAPEATLVIVRFDFDGNRNSTASIIDGIDWIFQQAAAAGMPAVINMSLGTDYGPHDGSTLEELGINDLTGPGRIVMASSGNAGRTGLGDNVALWGHPIHGSGTLSNDTCSDITVDIPTGLSAGDNYIFFDVFYEGSDQARVQVTTPSGSSYPPNFKKRYKNTWTTGSAISAFNTSEGRILVGNGGDQLDWGMSNGDHELYIEISDTDSGNAPAAGVWTVCLLGTDIVSEGTYHGWHGTSDSMTETYLEYEGVVSNNEVTVGSPATADNVISVGAYTTRMGWESWDPFTDTFSCTTYNVGPLSYYDDYYVDLDSDGEFTHDFGGDCYFDPELGDTAEPFDMLAFFSSRGPRRDGVLAPDISAPGVGIVSSLSSTVLADEIAAGPGVGYFTRTNRVHADGLHAVLQGTSMSCPNATGAVALLLQADGGMSPADVRSTLGDSARSDATTGAVPNADWGYGRLDVDTALSLLICLDDADCDDADPCTADSCDAGSCVHVVAGDETSCGGADLCCGGVCDAPACSIDDDCGPVDSCSVAVCNNPDSCGSQCQVSEVACIDGDGCCPSACNDANDDDCGGPVCLDKGASCTNNGECCSNRCKGRRGVYTCR